MSKREFYINVEWEKGNTQTLEKCCEANKADAYWDYANKYGQDKVWVSTRATKSYYSKQKES